MPNERLFFALVLGSVLLITCVDSDCGRPHKPAFGGHNRKQSQRLKEDSIVSYYCNQSYRLVFDEHRICKFGDWSGRPALCVKPITSDISLKKVIIFSDRMDVFNISGSYDDIYIWRTEDNQKCVTSDSLSQQNWTLILSKPEVINYFVLKLKGNPFAKDSDVKQSVKSILINKKQIEITKHLKTCSLMNFNTNNELEFICHSFRKLKTQTKTENDKSDEILINFNSNFTDFLSICGLAIYRFPQNCGKIGLSLEMSVESVNDGTQLEASCSDGYDLIGSSQIFCSNGQWIGSPSCKPQITCPLIEPVNKYDMNVVRIEYRNGFYFNKTLTAVNETIAHHYCFKNNTTNSNKSFSRNVLKYTRQCENGVWSEVETDCDTLLIDDPSLGIDLNRNNYFPIIITMVIMIVIFSVLSVGSYFAIKFRNHRKHNKNERNSSDIKNKLVVNTRNVVKYTNNRLSDPFDDSVYSIVAEDNYDVLNYDVSQMNLSSSQNYDDTEVPKPLYLEIFPLTEQCSRRGSIQSFISLS